MVVGVDGSAASDAAVRWAAGERVLRDVLNQLWCTRSRRRSPPRGIVVCSYASTDGRSIRRSASLTTRAGFSWRAWVTADTPDIDTKLFFYAAVPALVDASKDAQMVVVGRRGTGTFGRHLLGSVSSGLVHHAHCPVAVIPEAQEAQPHRRRCRAGPAGRRRFCRIGVGDVAGVRRGLAPRGRTGRLARMERCRCLPHPRYGPHGELGSKARKPWPNDWPGGRSTTPTSGCSVGCSATGPPAG